VVPLPSWPYQPAPQALDRSHGGHGTGVIATSCNGDYSRIKPGDVNRVIGVFLCSVT